MCLASEPVPSLLMNAPYTHLGLSWGVQAEGVPWGQGAFEKEPVGGLHLAGALLPDLT